VLLESVLHHACFHAGQVEQIGNQSGEPPAALEVELEQPALLAMVQKAVRLQGSFSHNWPVWERVIALLGSGALDVRPLIGGVFPLREWKAAFEKMERGEIVKAVLRTREG